MNRNAVIKKIKEATNDQGRIDMEKLDNDAIAQIANAYVSGAKGLLPLYSKSDLAVYYEVSEAFVSRCIDWAIVFSLIKFNTVILIIQNSADNERRHAEHKSLTGSEKRYAELVLQRFLYFKETINNNSNSKKYDAAYKMYLGQTSLKRVMSMYGFSEAEMIYLLKRKACTEMTLTEYFIFRKKFYYDFIGKPYYFDTLEYINNFRDRHKEALEKISKLKASHKENSQEYKEVMQSLINFLND